MSEMSLSVDEPLPVVVCENGKVRLKSSHRASIDISGPFPVLPLPRHQQYPSNEEDPQGNRMSNSQRPYSSISSVEPSGSLTDGDGYSERASSPSLIGADEGTMRNGGSFKYANAEGSTSEWHKTSLRANGRASSAKEDVESIRSRKDEERTSRARKPAQYADELKRYLNTSSQHLSIHRDSGHGADLLQSLRDALERDKSFVDEFVESPIYGLSLLIRLLEEIQTERREDDQRGSERVTPSRGTPIEGVCLLCIGLIIRHQEHLFHFLGDAEATQTVSESSLTASIRINIPAIQVLSLICDNPKGLDRVIGAISRTNSRSGNSGRFTGYVYLLNSTTDDHDKATIVRFFNDLWRSASDLSTKIFFQKELQLANFRPEHITQRCSSNSSSAGTELLLQELDTWSANCIDSSTFTSVSRVTEAEKHSAALRHETEQLRSLLKDSERRTENLEENRQELVEKCNSYHENLTELQEKVRQFRILYQDRTGCDIDDDARLLMNRNPSAPVPCDTVQRNFIKQVQLRYGTIGTIERNTLMQLAQRPSNSSYLSNSIRLKMTSHPHLPQLNWTPMLSVRSTIFENMDIEAVLRELDFSDLDTIFRLPSKMECVASRNRRERAMQRLASKIHFVENNRAKNMVITQRKTGLNPIELRLAIDSCDVSNLPPESAQLLLKYIPNREELQQINVYSGKYEELDDAERILLEMSRVQRLEAKLNVMVFIGFYGETISKIKKDIETLRTASESVIESERLRGILEVVLVFGNYLNCTKRGLAFGFKLDSLAKLSEVKSQNKSITLLHHLVSVFENVFPPLTTFYEDLVIDKVKSVSNQEINENILTLRKGVETVNEELQNQPTNSTIYDFYIEAASEVDALNDPYMETVNSYRAVCNLFGENHRLVEPAELFGHLINFITAFKKASIDNYNRLNPPLSSRQSEAEKKSIIQANPQNVSRKITESENGKSSPQASNRIESQQKSSNYVISTSERPISNADRTSTSLTSVADGSRKRQSTSTASKQSTPPQEQRRSITSSANQMTSLERTTWDDVNEYCNDVNSYSVGLGSSCSVARPRSSSHSVYYAAVKDGHQITTSSSKVQKPKDDKRSELSNAKDNASRQLPPVICDDSFGSDAHSIVSEQALHESSIHEFISEDGIVGQEEETSAQNTSLDSDQQKDGYAAYGAMEPQNGIKNSNDNAEEIVADESENSKL